MYRIKFIREEKEILVEPGTRILEAEEKQSWFLMHLAEAGESVGNVVLK